MSIVGQGRKYKHKLSRQARYMQNSGSRPVIILKTRVGKYKFGARIGKRKLGARSSKYKSGTRTGKYKLEARVGVRTGGLSQGREPKKGPGAGTNTHPVIMFSVVPLTSEKKGKILLWQFCISNIKLQKKKKEAACPKLLKNFYPSFSYGLGAP